MSFRTERSSPKSRQHVVKAANLALGLAGMCWSSCFISRVMLQALDLPIHELHRLLLEGVRILQAPDEYGADGLVGSKVGCAGGHGDNSIDGLP